MTVTVTGGQTDAGTYTATAEALTGTAVGNYQMPSTKPTTSFTIGKANPTVTDVKVAEPAAIYESTELAQIKLTHAEGDTPGTVALVAVQTLTVGTKDYCGVYCHNQRSWRYNLQEQALFHIYQ